MNFEQKINNELKELDLFDFDLHRIASIFLSREVTSDSAASFFNDFINNDLIKYFEKYDKKRFEVDINTTFDENDLKNEMSEYFYNQITIKDSYKKQSFSISIYKNGRINFSKEISDILSEGQFSSLNINIALVPKIGVTYNYCLYKEYNCLIRHTINTDLLKNKKEEVFYDKDHEIYKDIGQEIENQRTITPEFFELLTLKYDYNEKQVKNLFLDYFKELDYLNINDSTISVLNKRNNKLIKKLNV